MEAGGGGVLQERGCWRQGKVTFLGRNSVEGASTRKAEQEISERRRQTKGGY